ncbi:MAG: NAD-dependent epimerase/dehydratase family protein [Anaerolineales bacterium]
MRQAIPSYPTHSEPGEDTILFGGSGFLGPYILENYPKIISVGRTPPPTANRHIRISELGNLDALEDVAFDKVIYIIGNTDHYNLEKDVVPRGEPTAFDYHTFPLIQTLEQLKNRHLKKFIYFSTVLIYDEHKLNLPVSERAPIDPYKNRYTMSKYLGEELCKFYASWVPIITVRMSNLYGPTPLQRYDLIHVVSRRLLRDGRAEIWSRRPERDFIYVEDAAHAIVQLLYTDYTGILNLGTGASTPVSDAIDVLQAVSGCPIIDRDIPVQGPMRFECDMSTVYGLIDWRPQVSVEEGVRRTFEQMRDWGVEA